MKLKHIIISLLFCASAFGQINIRPIAQINDINRLNADYYVKQVTWFQGDSIRWDVYARDVRAPISFVGQSFPVLFIAAETNRQQVYVAKTGTVVSATNGHVRVEIPASGATLSTSINYAAWMTVFRAAGGSTAEVATVAYNAVRVLPSPLGVTYTNVPIATNYSIDVSGILTEYDPIFTASVAGAISSTMTGQWSTAYGWGNHATQGYGQASAIVAASNSLASQIAAVASNNVLTSNAMVNATGDTMSGDLGFTNAGLVSLDFVEFDAAPTGAVSSRRAQWLADRATVRIGLNANVNLDLGQQLMLYAKNVETNAVNKGEVVIVSGASGDNPTIKRASNASEALSARTIGIVAENISSNNNGFVVTRGTIYNVDTSAWAAGVQLYLGSNGTLQTNLPAAPLNGVFVGTVERVGENNGQIYVAVQNYQELEELSDVKITSAANRDLVAWNAASNRWENFSASGLNLATGTPLYAFSETDPAFIAASNSFYPRSNPSNYLTTATLAGYATGTPLYAFSETDPVWASASNSYYTIAAANAKFATGSPVYSVQGFATGTPLYAFAETDTIATNRLTNYYTSAQIDGAFATTQSVNSTFLKLSGGTVTGTLTTANIVGNLNLTIKAGDQTTSTADLSLSGGLGTLIGATGNVIITSNLRPDGGIKAKTATDLTLTAGDGQGSPFNQNSGNLVLSAGTGGPNTEGTIIANSPVTMTDGLTVTNGDIFMMGSGAYGLKLRPDANTADGNSKRIYLTSRNSGQENTAEIYKRKEDHALVYYWNGQERDVFVGNGFENDGQYRLSGQIDLLGSIRLVDSNSLTVGSITATGGVKVGQNSFQADLAGNISQDATNTASLGVVSATSLSGNHIGNAANLTNFPAQLATTTFVASSTASLVSTGTLATTLLPYATTNYVTNVTAAYLPLAGGTVSGNLNLAGNAINGLQYINYGSNNSINVYGGQFSGTWAFLSEPTVPGYLTTSTFYQADSVTNYQSRLQFVGSSNAINTRLISVEGYTNRAALAATTNFVTNALAAYLPLAGGTVVGDVSMNGQSFTNVNNIYGEDNSGYIYFQPSSFAVLSGVWAFDSQPTIPGYQTITGSVNAANLTNLSAIAGAGLAVVSNKFITTNDVAQWINYPAGSTLLMATNAIADAASLSFPGRQIDLQNGNFTGAWSFAAQPTIPGYLTTNGSAAGLSGFPASLLTVSAGNSNYWRVTTAPASSTSFGARGQIAVGSSNLVYVYNPDALGAGTGRWIRLEGSVSW